MQPAFDTDRARDAKSNQPLLLMLPGMVCGAASWQQQHQALSAHVDVVIADYQRCSHVTLMARRQLEDHHGPLLLAGHSMGGRVALEMIRLAPERVIGLCLIATESRARPDDERGLAEDDSRQRLYRLAAEKGMAAMAEAWIPALIGPREVNNASLRATLINMISDHDPEALARHINAGKTRPNSYDLLSKIKCPTLIIAGEYDAIRPPPVLQEMHHAIGNSSFLMIEGCGHMPMMEAPEVVNQAMLEWLNRSLSSSIACPSMEATNMTKIMKSPSSHVTARRQANRVGKLHHHAFLAKDMEATRVFYEDILGMPLVGTWVERVNPVTGQPDNYVHTFFELSDGSCLAFFQFKSPASSLQVSVNHFENINPFAHHLALTVEGEEEIKYFKARLIEAGVEVFETDHGYCHSIYFHDPSGMQVELTTLVPESEQMMEEAAASAHEMLSRWLSEDDVAGNNTRRGEGWIAN